MNKRQKKKVNKKKLLDDLTRLVIENCNMALEIEKRNKHISFLIESCRRLRERGSTKITFENFHGQFYIAELNCIPEIAIRQRISPGEFTGKYTVDNVAEFFGDKLKQHLIEYLDNNYKGELIRALNLR